MFKKRFIIFTGDIILQDYIIVTMSKYCSEIYDPFYVEVNVA